MKRLSVERAFSFAVVILGAGRSTRMGRPKLLLPWGHTSVLGHLLGQWRALRAAQIAVVCAPGNRAIQDELDRVAFQTKNRIYNPTPEHGMYSSIQCAARWPGWQPGLTHWAIVLGDQPHLQRQTLRRVRDFTARHPARVCQPARQGHGRHPVLLPKAVFRQLAGSRAATLRAFLAARARRIALCELDDPGLDLDIDRPEDYENALARASLPRTPSGSGRRGVGIIDRCNVSRPA